MLLRRPILLMLLAACAPEPEVAFSCEYAYTYDRGVDLGDFESGTLDCETYLSSGDQLLLTLEQVCEAEGIAAEALEAVCVCVYDSGQRDCEDG